MFSEAGAYLFRIRTPLGKTREISLYIVHPGEDLAFSQYFGEGLTDASLRIYDPPKAVPVYMTGKEFSISPASANFVPEFTGRYIILRTKAPSNPIHTTCSAPLRD